MIRGSPSTDLDEILKQIALEEGEEPEPEPKEWATTVVKLAEGIWLTASGIEVFEGIDWNEQRAAAGQGIARMLAGCEELLKEKKRSSSRQILVLDFHLGSYRGHFPTRVSNPNCV